MKLYCSVTVINRVLPSLSMKSTTKYKNAFISIIKPSKTSDVYLVLVTQSNKAGYRYKIQQNVEKTFGQFSDEGKCTIRFKEPPHDLCISADKNPLRNFMLYIKKVWRGEEKNIPPVCKEINVAPQSRLKSIKLEIKKKSDYPVLKGFPSTLQSLTINECSLKKCDLRILKLKHLSHLNLSHNNLTSLPDELGALAIKQLLLTDNNLSQANWTFLTGPIANSVEYLDLSGNKMKYLPGCLSRFHSLKEFKVSRNDLMSIPFGLCRLTELQNLDLSYNHLRAVPGTIMRKYMKKLVTLDVSGNHNLLCVSERDRYISNSLLQKEKHPNPLLTLLDLAGQRIIDHRLRYGEETLPGHLVRLLDNASQCSCGKTTIAHPGTIYRCTDSKSLAYTFISTDRQPTVPLVFVPCSKKYNENTMYSPSVLNRPL